MTSPLPTIPQSPSSSHPSDRPYDQAQPLWDHLEEFRRRVILSLVSIALAAVGGWFLAPRLLHHLSDAVGTMVFLRPTEAFMVRLKTAGVLGAIMASPVWLFHAWRFVGVALTLSERRVVTGALPFSLLLFLAGAALAWFLITPAGLKFLMTFGDETLRPMISVGAALEFALWMSLGMGLLFQWPVVAAALASWGFLTAAMLREHRRHAVLLILVLAGVITPGPDVTSQLLLAAPTYLLYEVSIFLAAWLAPKNA